MKKVVVAPISANHGQATLISKRGARNCKKRRIAKPAAPPIKAEAWLARRVNTPKANTPNSKPAEKPAIARALSTTALSNCRAQMAIAICTIPKATVKPRVTKNKCSCVAGVCAEKSREIAKLVD